MSAEGTLRDSLNTADLNRISPVLQDVQFGEVVNALLLAMTPTESGIHPSESTEVLTLADVPLALLDVSVTAGTVTGHKKILKGFTAADGTVQPVPATGQCTWDGGTSVRFAAADDADTVDVLYTLAADPTASYLQRSLGEQDT